MKVDSFFGLWLPSQVLLEGFDGLDLLLEMDLLLLGFFSSTLASDLLLLGFFSSMLTNELVLLGFLSATLATELVLLGFFSSALATGGSLPFRSSTIGEATDVGSRGAESLPFRSSVASEPVGMGGRGAMSAFLGGKPFGRGNCAGCAVLGRRGLCVLTGFGSF